jgi:alkylation response protein AidB-like acyl-CoA dehydrogenase
MTIPGAIAPAVGHPPSADGLDALERCRRFLADTARPIVEAFEREHGDTTFELRPDGRITDHALALKRTMQELAAREGLYSPHLPREDGGLGLGLVDCFYLQEEVFRHGLRGFQHTLAWTDGPSHLVRHWSPEMRETHLAPFLGGSTNVAFALTEPAAGSDFPGLSTTARRDGGAWILNGRKHLITGAPFAELAQVFARRPDDPRGRLTAFLVPLDAPGVTRGTVQQTIMADGQTGEIGLEEVPVPASAVIGEVGAALPLAFLWINWARTRRGGMCSGLARHCLSRAVGFAREREAFGRPIGELGVVASAVSDIALECEAMRALSLEGLARLDRSSIFETVVTAADRATISILKTWNDEALCRVADAAVQIHGGRGLVTEYGLEKIFRVARNLRIPAGTTEVQRATIAQALLGELSE